MISEEAIAVLDEPIRSEVKRAVVLLAASSVLSLQKDLNLVRLANGSATESDTHLAERVMEYRRQNNTLDLFAALAESLAEKED